jgi:hypothetical protein
MSSEVAGLKSINQSKSAGQRQRSMPVRNDLVRRRREDLRRRFRPACVRLLFIGEAPPASGRFFYRRDSGLYRAMRDAFHAIDPAVNEQNFLSLFQSTGCYLIDLCPDPVDRLDRQSRLATCRNSEASLGRSIARLEPSMILTVVRSIEDNVARAGFRAGWRGPFLHLPYPGRWSRHRDVFVATLARNIGALLEPATAFQFTPGCPKDPSA